MNIRYGLSDGTWTHGLHHPKVARYQAALHPDPYINNYITTD